MYTSPKQALAIALLTYYRQYKAKGYTAKMSALLAKAKLLDGVIVK